MAKILANIALKFILHKTRGILGFVRKAFLLALLGLVVSVLSLILLNSIENGYKHSLKSKLSNLESDLEIVSETYISPPPIISLIEENSSKGIDRYCASAQTVSIMKFAYLSEGVEVVSNMEGDCSEHVNFGEIILGSGLKDKLNLSSGDEIVLSNSEKNLSSMGFDKKMLSLKVSSFLNTGTPNDNYRVLINKEDFRDLFEVDTSDNFATNIKVYLKDSEEQESLKNKLKKYFANDRQYNFLAIYTFDEKYNLLSQVLDQIFRTISIIIIFFVGLAILNIISSIWLIVESRRRQIKYLLLAGMKRVHIFLIFITISALLITISFFIGYVLAEIIIFFQNKYQFISISSNVYIISNLVGIVDYKYLLTFFGFFIGFGLVFSLIPCYKIMRKSSLHV
mgnify:FL=1